MKFLNPLKVFTLVALLFLISCSGDNNNDDDNSENTAPVASFTVDPVSGTVQTNFLFDASACTDAEQDASGLEVRWDWNNDGSWDTDYSTTKTMEHQFTVAGDHMVTLEVKDDDALTSTETKLVHVTNQGDLSFVTGISSQITETSAQMTGEIISVGGEPITNHGHCWSVFPDPDVSNSKTSLGSVTNPSPFTSDLTQLTEQILYYVKAYVETGQGVYYGDLVTFETSATASITPCPDAETVTDADGNVYHTVLIDGTCWMRENLNVGTRINSSQNQQDNNTIEKYCYNDDVRFCDVYGALYQWKEMMQYVNNVNNQGICPDGWHLPTFEEILALYNHVASGYELISQGAAVGSNNNTGFSALMSGYKSYLPPAFTDYGTSTNFWTTKRYDPSPNTASISLGISDNGSSSLDFPNQNSAFSVRCVKD